MAYAAGVASTAWAGVTGKEPLAPLDGVRMARKKMWVRHDKAARELGYRAGPGVGSAAARGGVVSGEWILLRTLAGWWPPSGVSSMEF